MPDRLTGVAAFVEAAEAGSFAAAAARLGLSRSAIGKTVGRLEARLGVRLFHRTTRSQRLTDDGQVFYERCVRALGEIEAAEATLESGRREPIGRLRVSVPVLFGRRCVAPILLDLAHRHPGLELELSFNDRLVDLVQDGFDLAVRNGPLADSAGLMTRRLAGQRMVICAAPGYVAARGAPRSLEELAAHDTLPYGRAGQVHTWGFPGDDGRAREIPLRGRVCLDDLEAIADAAAAGFGLAWLPRWLVADRVRSGELVPVLPDVQGFVFDVHAVWPQAPHVPARVRAAIDALAARLPRTVGDGSDWPVGGRRGRDAAAAVRTRRSRRG